MSGSEAEGCEQNRTEAYSFLNLPPEGSKAESEMIARQAEAFISMARFYLNGKSRDARAFTDTTDLIFQSLERTLKFLRDKCSSLNDERHLRRLVDKNMDWFLRDSLKKERRRRRDCVSLDEFESLDLPVRSSLEQDIEFVDALATAMTALQQENPEMHEVMILVRQGMPIREIAELTDQSKSRVGELRAKAIAKVKLFFEFT